MSAFEWDTEKNRANQRKHGISFEEACTIFNGPVLCGEDPGGHDEISEPTYGLLGGTAIVCVVHTERAGRLRIIGARKATRTERTLFHAYLKKATG
jgi:uncharacterized protein